MAMTIQLNGQRALVTGGSSGIGEAVSLALAAAGAKVAVNYIGKPDAANTLAARIKGQGGEALTVAADVSQPDQVAAMFKQVDASWGGVDILVNNAGIDGARANAWEAEVAAWRRVIDINLVGAFLCAREALARMVPARHGVVVSITSVHEYIAWAGYSAYTASKAGLSMLTKTLAQEAAPAGVRVLSVAPGAIRTPINRDVWDNPRGLQDLDKKIAMGRMGEREEVANMIVVLASGAASYVTGCSLLVDGGMTDYPDFAHGG